MINHFKNDGLDQVIARIARRIARFENDIALAKEVGADTDKLLRKWAAENSRIEGPLSVLVDALDPSMRENPLGDVVRQEKIAEQKELFLAAARADVAAGEITQTAKLFKRLSREQPQNEPQTPRKGLLDRLRKKSPRPEDPEQGGPSR